MPSSVKVRRCSACGTILYNPPRRYESGGYLEEPSVSPTVLSCPRCGHIEEQTESRIVIKPLEINRPETSHSYTSTSKKKRHRDRNPKCVSRNKLTVKARAENKHLLVEVDRLISNMKRVQRKLGALCGPRYFDRIEEDTRTTYKFFTAGGPPIADMESISHVYPQLEFELDFEVIIRRFTLGSQIFDSSQKGFVWLKNGKVIYEKPLHFNLPSGEPHTTRRYIPQR